MRLTLLRSVAIAALAFSAAPALAQAQAAAPAAAQNQDETTRFKAFLEQVWQADLASSPQMQTYLGVKKDYGKWDDATEAAQIDDYARALKALATMRETFDYNKLSPEAQLSWRVFESVARSNENAFRFRNYGYIFDQMNGEQSGIPAFLINMHRVDTVSDAENYISRLNGVAPLMDTLMAEAVKREKLGILPPKWVFPYVISDAKNVITGAPFTQGADSALMADFRAKVKKLKLPADQEKALIGKAQAALTGSVKPAYEKLIALMQQQEARAPTQDGVWRLPNGDKYYAERLAYYTTTDMTADEIHNFGLSEMDRIHKEMEAIARKVGFKGTLKEFMQAVQNDPKQFYPNTDAGREAYIKEATAVIDAMRAKLPGYFGVLPKADMIVKRVEPFREKSAGKAFYQSPAPDGSRPGTYYANLYDMKDMPKFQLEALAYHEGIPGHHLQRAISGELKGIPNFQKYGRFTAYTEGWGLYTELLAKEMGAYQDPYADFGRLSQELWRAARLVVDTGIHYKKWSREQAIQYLLDNTPNSEGEARKAIERYIVYPGQATAYLIGKTEILRAREAAKAELGDKFDIRAFHDVVLGSGPVPLDIMKENVQNWVKQVKAQS
ncbi:DUF885 domain-containing protein [Pedomonas mirosovicensis]|uniref:DUF885 domain-containing protein n=1 Tax=Pedomonas mirosovicensis TaxID=2908641 RepID=UPI002169327C|nr:DUF885 domain-containing protein [Pedomonas mirosovicensis]MCH8683932.1 DUF885 domain-containing protein [Pedomonas mirosovicensis]